MNNKLKILIACFIVALLFTTCKKYPKNTLWLKNPYEVIARGKDKPWLLEYYSVNDIDSTSANYLKVWREEGLITYINGTVRKGSKEFHCLDVLERGSWNLTEHKKQIHFRFNIANFFSNSSSNPNYINQGSVFSESGIGWEINKLTKDQFWIITESKGRKYEIHFR